MPDLFIERAGRLVPMTDLPFTSEDIFQALLGRHPALLEGDLLTPDREQRRFLLVCGMPVPDSEGGGGRWSSDHLFLDQDGIHTMVEIKRSSDTRIGREVIGRVLDYAANATAYWPQENLRERLDATQRNLFAAYYSWFGAQETEDFPHWFPDVWRHWDHKTKPLAVS